MSNEEKTLMESKKVYYNKWWVTEDFIHVALQDIEEQGHDMSKVFIVPAKSNESQYIIFYNSRVKDVKSE